MINSHKKNSFTSALFFVMAFIFFVNVRGEEGIKPNMIFILADDCTYKDLELYGGQAKTLNMNQLAVEGVTFNKVYQSSAMCSPNQTCSLHGPTSVKERSTP